jgi:DNA-binding XRE family transcriptional regulator
VSQPPQKKSPLNQRLRARRLRVGMNQTEAARAIGTTREHYNRVELGVYASPELLVKLARVLGMRIGIADVFPEGD